MTDISFYHLTSTPLEKALPRLLEKVLASGERAVLLARDEARLRRINDQLWTYGTEKFLPHGMKEEGDIERQPVYLTVQEENPNNASFLVLLDGISPGYVKAFKRCLDIFDGANQNEVESARKRWQSYKDQGHILAYWKQDEKGAWQKAE